MKRIINTEYAPAPIGPYNQATEANNTLYVSGQIAFDPSNGQLILDNIEAETTRVLDNLKAIVVAAGYQMSDVVKCSVFVSDMELFSRINAIYSKYFDDNTAPARELVQVANLPRYVNVEISCIAAR